LKVLKDEELEARLQELREEKTRLTDAFVSGRIPQDVYKKTVMRIEKQIGNIREEMTRRTAKRQDTEK
jgi:predicted  nucleic acid-binding Zn-ribbon protein